MFYFRKFCANNIEILQLRYDKESFPLISRVNFLFRFSLLMPVQLIIVFIFSIFKISSKWDESSSCHSFLTEIVSFTKFTRAD